MPCSYYRLVPSKVDETVMCHCPPGQPDKCVTMPVNDSKLSAHVGKHAGGRLGDCNTEEGAQTGDWTLGKWYSFNIPFDPTWTDEQAVENGWVADGGDKTQPFAKTMTDVYSAEIRTYGTMDRVLGSRPCSCMVHGHGS